ncbi:serine/threonine-protein kinase [Streptomyces sp. NBC_01426]|uniref:serine/threonine-protein kinase n=1 Tax=unclassified Streptomyces TaxID=2593676 RepID=UPI002E364A06|nr:serine/threonine-protein kinase [Streptomyces sp. NBC_01426]
MRSLRATDCAGFPEYAGQYRLESVLGSGGMGVVHLATSGAGLKLAVKVVHAQHAVDPEFRARFRQEVAAARRVSGAFTAPVVDADPDAERPWMATSFIDAPTLSERVRERVLDPVELVRLAAGLAEALRDIHRAGVVHRDLKPSNVLMAPDGVRVIDFGISRPADSDLRTETGKLIGTPPFMAPEQFQRPRDVGTAADVFALGAVLVYAATGRGPFDSDSHYLVAYQVVHSEPDLTGLPARLVPLVARCLSKEPEERPTADELITEMRALAYPTSEDTQSFVPRPRRPERVEVVTHRRERIGTDPPADPLPPGRRPRLRTRTALAAGVALLVGAGAVVGHLYSGSEGDAAARAAARSAAASEGRPPAFAPWTASVGERGAGRRTVSCSADAAALYCSGPGVAAAKLDPANGSVLWSVPGSASTRLAARDNTPSHAGGLVLAVASGSEVLEALDPASGTRRWRHELPDGARVVPVGARVLIVAPNGNVAALDAATGATGWTKQIGGVGSVWTAGPGPSGEPVLYVSTTDGAGGSTQLSEVDPASGSVRRRVRVPGMLQPVGVARGGLYLLDNDVRTATEAVVRVDLDTHAVHRVRLARPLYETQATVSPEGVVYVFGTAGGLAAVGPVKEEWRLETGAAVASRPVFAGGRVYLTAADGRLLAVDAAAGRPVGQTKPGAGGGQGTFAATLPAPVVRDGRVYASTPDGTVFAVDAANPAGW